MTYVGYAGTYTSGKSEGIYRFTYENRKIKDVQLFQKVWNPKYLTFIGEYIAAVCDFADGSGVAVYDQNGNEIDRLVFEESTSCYIGNHDRYLYTANYHAGTASLLKFENEKLTLTATVSIREKAGCHQVLHYRNMYLVPCLFLDKIIVLSDRFEVIDEIRFESGAGPRHGVFSDDLKYLYIVGELSNLLYAVDMHTKTVVSQVELLENGKTYLKDSAAIRKKGNYLYVSTRTQDVISVVKVSDGELTRIQVCSAFGSHPRDFLIVDDEIIVANRFSNTLSVLPIKDAYVENEVCTVSVPEVVCVIARRKENE